MLESGEYTQSDAARQFNVSRERIRQLVKRNGIIYRKPVGQAFLKSQLTKQRLALKRLKKWQKELTHIERPRLNINLKIEVCCAQCKQYFVPSITAIRNRKSALKGQLSSGTECRLYCSDSCKQACAVFNKKGDGTSKIKHVRIDQPELRLLVLARDGNTCQQCGRTDSLVCHHIIPVSLEPIESADVDNCITLCESCHNEVHTGACSRVNLRCKEILDENQDISNAVQAY